MSAISPGVAGGVLLSACTAISGLAELETGPDQAGVATNDGGVVDEAGWAPPDENGGPSPRDDAGVDPGPSCAAPATCAPVPAGWQGPFAVGLAKGTPNEALACAPAFVRSWERVGPTADASTAPPAQCTCSCGPLGGSCVVTMHAHDEESCSDNGSTRTLTPGSCVEAPSNSDGFRATTQVQATCTPDASTNVVPLDQKSPLAIGCSPSAPGGCASAAVCMPPLPAGARLCVRPADESAPTPACPPEYPSSLPLPSGVEDTRGCTACTCTPSASCAFSYTLYDDSDCSGARGTYSDLDCHSPDSIDGLRLVSASLQGSCTPAGGAPMGGVTVQSASTLCCAP